MKSRISPIVAAFFGLSAGLAGHAQVVSKPDLRQSTLATAEAVLSIKQSLVPVDAIDPFNSAAFSHAMGQSRPTDIDAPRVGPRGDREILEAIGAQLKPTGNFIISGQQTLIFGQKRVKAGMPMTINFEGTEYTIEITAIDRTSFTLRLNREELTRPIK